MIIKMKAMIDRLGKTARSLCADNRGVAALEFAMIAPLLITLYLGTLEISGALQMNKKVGRAASTAGDILGQSPTSVTKADVEAILMIGKAITQPYALTQPTIIATAITIDKDANATVLWSRQLADTSFSRPYAPGSTVPVPAGIRVANTFLIKVEAKLEYRTLTTWTIAQASGQTYGTINMSETYFHSVRTDTAVACTDC